MDLANQKDIKALLDQHHIKPSKGLGQNFLIDKKFLTTIIEAAKVQATDTVIEVGPGIGTLTQELAKHAQKVITIEKDQSMIPILQESLKSFTNIEVINGDALDFEIPVTDYKVIANIPYYITSPLIRKFLEATSQPKSITLMIQKEVAKRICAKPNDMSLLAVSVQCYAAPKIIGLVSRGAFWPSPNVDSAIISIVPFEHNPYFTKVTPDAFFTVVKAGFSQARKQLANNLSNSLKKDKTWVAAWLLGNNIDPKRRAETLTIEEWVGLTHSFSTNL